MSKQNLYFGFGTFEELLESSDVRVLYLQSSRITRTAEYSTRLIEWSVVGAIVHTPPAGRALADSVVHYWRMPLGSYRTIADGRGGTDHGDELGRSRALSALDILRPEAESRGFEVIGGLLTFPRDFPLLDGGSALIEYDPNRACYVRPETLALEAA